MTKNFWIILILALVLRLTIAPITYHSDIQTADFGSYVLTKGYVLNFYDYLPNLPKDDIAARVFTNFNFNYPPLVYFFLGFFATVFSFLISYSFQVEFLFNVKELMGNPLLFLHLITLKLPYLFFDLGIALILMKFFDNQRQKLLIFAFWLFNPVNLYATYMMGQFDIIPTFFVILSLYFALKNAGKSLFLSALLLGIGAAFKLYPLFLLVPLMGLTSSWKKRLTIAFLGVIPYLLTILPFLSSGGYRSSALVANQTLKSFDAKIVLSGAESIILFLALLFLFYIAILQFRQTKELIWQRFAIPLFLFFALTHYHPQWFLWLTPFLIIDLVKSNFKNLLLFNLALISWLVLVFFFESGLSTALFAPIIPSLYDGPTIWQMLGVSIDQVFFRNIFQSLFVGSAIYYLYLYFPRKTD